MTDFVLGIDSGSTAVKVTIFDATGAVRGRGSASVPRIEISPGYVERDPEVHWHIVAAAVRQTITSSSIDPRRIVAVGLAGQGDGVHLVDKSGRPVGRAILSSDTRAEGIIAKWAADGTLDLLLQATGQVPFPGSPAPLLRWLVDHQPERLRHTRWVLSAKDWLQLQLTGTVQTDRTDAAASFAGADDHVYSAAALGAVGLNDLGHLLPPVVEPTSVSAGLTSAAATELGLQAGTPVSAGLHDVTAAILGSVGLEPGRLCMIVGTFGVNVVLTTTPLRSHIVNTRSGPTAGLWTSRRTSRGAIANVEWVAGVTPGVGQRDVRTRAAITRVLDQTPNHEPPLFIPFLFGGNAGQPQSAAFLDLRSWHTPDDLVRAVIEGVTFNHRFDADLIADELGVSSIHLSGGVIHNAPWRQLFADVLERPVSYAPGDDAGPRGAAITAAVGAGIFPDLAAGSAAFAPHLSYVSPRAEPDAIQGRFTRYRDVLAQLAGQTGPAR